MHLARLAAACGMSQMNARHPDWMLNSPAPFTTDQWFTMSSQHTKGVTPHPMTFTLYTSSQVSQLPGAACVVHTCNPNLVPGCP